ncbi:hypothetical protein ACFX13_005108 [Malus domestica]
MSYNPVFQTPKSKSIDVDLYSQFGREDSLLALNGQSPLLPRTEFYLLIGLGSLYGGVAGLGSDPFAVAKPEWLVLAATPSLLQSQCCRLT